MKERAGYLLQASPSNKDVMDAMAEVEARHEALAANTRKNIEELEWMTDNLSAHQELYATHQEWQKDMWEKLHSQTGEQGLRGGGIPLKTAVKKICVAYRSATDYITTKSSSKKYAYTKTVIPLKLTFRFPSLPCRLFRQQGDVAAAPRPHRRARRRQERRA